MERERRKKKTFFQNAFAFFDLGLTLTFENFTENMLNFHSHRFATLLEEKNNNNNYVLHFFLFNVRLITFITFCLVY